MKLIDNYLRKVFQHSELFSCVYKYIMYYLSNNKFEY